MQDPYFQKWKDKVQRICYGMGRKNTTSLDEGTSSDVLCLDCSPCRPVLVAFLLEKASTAPENLSRRSCPTGQDSQTRDNSIEFLLADA